MNKTARIEAAILIVLLCLCTILTLNSHRKLSALRLEEKRAESELNAYQMQKQQAEEEDAQAAAQIEALTAEEQDRYNTYKLWETYTKNITKLTE